MAGLNERHRLWITIGASLALSGGVTALVMSDRAEIQSSEEEIAAREEQIRSADAEIRKTKEREDQVLVLREVEQREMEILPLKQQIGDFHANLTTFLTQAGAQFVKLPESAPKESEVARGVYVTPNTIEFQADAAALLRFVNMIENDPRLVAVKGIKVKSGGRSKDGKPTLHACEVHLETYHYDPRSGGGKPAPIPGEDTRREDPLIRQQVAAFQPERRETYALRPAAARRDPFLDPRREVVEEDPEAVKRRYDQEESVVLDLEKRLDEVREKSEMERAAHAASDLFKADRIAREVDVCLNEVRVRLANVASVKSVSFPDLSARVEKVKARSEEVAVSRKDTPRELRVTPGVAAQTRDAVRQAFSRGDYADVNTLCVAWEQFMRAKMVEDPALPFCTDIQAFRQRAKVLAEFQAKVIQVTGLIVTTLEPSRSVALVNGRTMKVGDSLDGKGDVVVLSIDKDGVEFGYQGERIKVPREDTLSAPRAKGAVSAAEREATVSPGPR